MKKKIDSVSIPAGRICCVNVGVVAHAAKESELEFKKDDVIHQENKEGYKKYIEGRDISRYLIEWGGDFIDYDEKRPHFHRPKFPELFESDKIAVPRVSGAGNKIEACFDQNGYYNNDNVTNVVKWSDGIKEKQAPKNFEPLNDTSDFDLKALNGIFNSSLVSYYFSQFLATGTLQGSYTSVYPEDIRKIPVHQKLDGNTESVCDLVTKVSKILNLRKEKNALNRSLLDHLGSYSDGETLSEIGFTQPPPGAADSILQQTATERPNLRIGRAEVHRESEGTVEIRLTARYKPDNEDAHETDQWGYTETDPLPAVRITDLTADEADLIEAFVPVAVDEAGGFAGFRETATKTNSPMDRLRKVTLPAVADVREGLASYRQTIERAEELEEKIERTDALIDEIVYELYGLTEEEIEIVEEAVGE